RAPQLPKRCNAGSRRVLATVSWCRCPICRAESKTSCTWWYPSCKRAACTVASTPAPRCAITWVWHARQTDVPPYWPEATEHPMKSLFVFSRRSLLKGALSAGALLAVPSFVHAAELPVIRYASAGVVRPGELASGIFSDWFKQNVLTRHGKDYVIETTTARGTPGVATLLAAGQADLGT